MKIDVKVTSLGKLETGTINIRPITVLTGPNGTGKSFFTKSLYSIFNVINKNVYHISITKSIRIIKLQLDSYIRNLNYAGENDFVAIKYLESGLDLILEQIELSSDGDIQEYLDFSKSRLQSVDELIDFFESYLLTLEGKHKKIKSIKSQSVTIKKSLLLLKSKLSNSLEHYNDSLAESLNNEISDNFQVSNLSELVTFGKETSSIIVDDLINIEFGSKGVGFSLGEDFINEVSSLSRVVFFESPAYWKVRDALKSAKERQNFHFYTRPQSNNVLTGVPKYFYDLDDALKFESKPDNVNEIDELVSLIKSELGGEFIFNGDKLIFKDSSTGNEVSKNLISFGMTNLGMIHTLLKSNVITPGSFVFIDEPETNLHPRWQVLLMNVLIKLAELNVNIVIATHSIDMLKALEVGVCKRDKATSDDFMSVHYFDIDGQLLEFESNQPVEQLIEARSELNSPYSELYFKGCQYD